MKQMEDYPSYDPGVERITEEDVKEARKEGLEGGIKEGKIALASEIDTAMANLGWDPAGARLADLMETIGKVREIINKLI